MYSDGSTRLERLVSPSVMGLLASVVRFHKDRDDQPLDFFCLYPTRRADPVPQRAYDSAIALLGTAASRLAVAEREQLWNEYGKYLGFEYLQPNVGAELATRPLDERIAHAVARTHIVRSFCDLSVHLRSGIPGESRVLTALPHLRERLTPRDVLLPLSDDVVIHETWMEHRQHELHVHPGMRRGFAGSPNAALLHSLAELRDRGCFVGLAIDHDRLSTKGTLSRLYECDRWFGEGYRDTRLDDPNAVGATLHERPYALGPHSPAGWRTEFRWASDATLKSFEAEELPVPSSRRAEGEVVCRYVHAIRDTHAQRFVHLDGALHVYGEGYLTRYEQSGNHHLRKVWADTKIKLFRIDSLGSAGIGTEDWTHVVQEFFRGNELPLEYFGGRSFGDIYRSHYGHEHPWLTSSRIGVGNDATA
jgi:hypothetical protein